MTSLEELTSNTITLSMQVPLCSRIVQTGMVNNCSRSQMKSYVKVIVGEGDNKKEFLAEEDLLKFYSGFFRAATKIEWESGRKKEVTLSEEDPKLVSIFLHWISTKTLTNAPEYIDAPASDWRSLERQHIQLYNLYVLGDYLQSPNFCNQVMDTIGHSWKRHWEEAPHTRFPCMAMEEISFIWSNVTDGSPLKKALVRNFYFCARPNFEEGDLTLPYATDFYVELSRFALAIVNQTEPVGGVWERTKCTYHQHPEMSYYYRCTESVRYMINLDA